MAERVDAQGGIHPRLRRRGQDGARRSPAGDGIAGLDRAHARGTTRIVGAAAHDGRARGQAGGRRGLRRHATQHLGRAAYVGEQGHRQPHRLQDLATPAQSPGIVHERPRGVGRLGGERPCQAEPHEVFGEQDGGHARERRGFVVPQPEHLGKREALEGRVADPLAQSRFASGPARDLPAFGRGPSIAPEQRRTDHNAAPVEKHRRVHLSRDPHRRDARGRLPVENLPRAREARLPPPVGVLLRPAGVRRAERQGRGRGGDHGARRIYQQGFDAARPDVEAEEQPIGRAHRTPSSSSIVSWSRRS